jgi:hypothetical protein
MTALYFETEDGQQLDTAIFDGYPVGDRLLDGVLFIVKIVDGKLEVTIHPNNEKYFSTLNTKLWLKKVTDYVQDYDVFIHPEYPENEEDVYLVTDEPAKPVVGVVGKAYTWEEVLQRGKKTLEKQSQGHLKFSS